MTATEELVAEERQPALPQRPGLLGAAIPSFGFDRFWRDTRTLSLHDPVDWKHAGIGTHVLTGCDPPPGIYT